jgi:peptidoglycan/LPS O-acetylase OafA/YrhL
MIRRRTLMATSVSLAPSQVDFLNLTRAGAAQLVLVGHTMSYYLVGGIDREGRIETFGVLVFFLLSGFLITLSALQKRDRDDYTFVHYLVDRFCRIFVAYVPALVFVAVVDRTLRPSPIYPYGDTSSALTWIGNLFMLQEYPAFQVLYRLGLPARDWFIEAYGSGRPFWTVAIEWWIYLFFGYLAFVVLRRRCLTGRDVAVLVFLCIVPLYNAMGGVGQCLSLVWAIGAAVAVLWDRLVRQNGARLVASRRQAAIWSVGVVLLSFLLLVGRTFAVPFKVYDLQFAIFVAGTLFGTLFLLGFAPLTLPQAFRRAINCLADYSYSLYLTHYTVLIFFWVHMADPTHHDPRMFTVVVVAANVFALVFAFLFERHHRMLARHAKAFMDRRLQLTPPRAA